jgi:hypothetical protein
MKMMDASRAIQIVTTINNQTFLKLSKTAYITSLIIPKIQQIIERLQENNQPKLHLDGLLGSATSLSYVRYLKSRRSISFKQ